MSSLGDTLASESPAHLEGEQLILFLWREAINRFNSKLTKSEKKKINITNYEDVSFEALLSTATEAKEISEEKRYSFTGTVRGILEVINLYAVAGDVIIQQHAEYTSIAWGAFRFLLMFAVQEGRTVDGLINALDIVAQTVFRVTEYAKYFASAGPEAGKILELLRTNLIHLYAETLGFLIRAKIFFQKSTPRRYFSAGFKPFDTMFKEILDRMRDYEVRVQKDIDLLRTERENGREECENGLWLCATDFTVELEKLQKQHLGGTGEWFLENEEVRNWIESSSTSLLWVQGKAGSGKSTLAALLVRHLSSESGVSGTPVLNLFCKTGEDNKNNLLSMLRNVIFQLLEQSKGSSRALHKVVGDERLSSKSQNAQSIIRLWSVLSDMLDRVPGVFCVIDALDECRESNDEISCFIEKITSVVRAAKAKTKIVVISRLDRSRIPADLQCFWRFHSIENSDVEDDIERFVSAKLRDSRILSRKGPEMNEKLRKALIGGSQGMILWASLMISELEAGHWAPLAVLEKPPTSLLALYSSILLRLVEKPEFTGASKILQLILAAMRPLRLDEFVFGNSMLAGASDDIHEYYSETNIRDEAISLISKVSPLVIIMPDETIQLAHASLKDFLLGEDLQGMARREPKLSHFSFDSRQLHEQIASTLVSYLSLVCFREKTSGRTGVTVQESYPLLEYASKNFIWHLTQIRDVSAETTQIFMTFFDSTQGWRWLQRLAVQYDMSMGHVQVLQSHVNEWLVSLPHETAIEWKNNHMNSFLVDLSRKRLEETRGLGRDDHPDTLVATSNLASAYFDQGRWKEAEGLRLQVLKARKELLGDDHRSTLTAMGNLASIYYVQGRQEEAEGLRLQVLAAHKRVLGDDHPDTLTTMNNLASTYSKQGRQEEAESLKLQVLATRKRLLGDEHPETLTAMGNLASTYYAQGRQKEAESLKLQVLISRKKVLGDDHPGTLTMMNNLASTYSKQGRQKEAEDLQLEVLAARKKVLGDNHPKTLTAMGNLANTYFKQGRYEEAESLQSEVLAARKTVLGDENSKTRTAERNLALTRKELEKARIPQEPTDA